MLPEKLLEERKEQFIKARYANEQRVNAYLETVFKKRDQEPEWFKDITFPIGRTAQEVLPSMYKEEFIEEDFMKEYAALHEFDKKIQAVAKKINEEAERILCS